MDVLCAVYFTTVSWITSYRLAFRNNNQLPDYSGFKNPCSAGKTSNRSGIFPDTNFNRNRFGNEPVLNN